MAAFLLHLGSSTDDVPLSIEHFLTLLASITGTTIILPRGICGLSWLLCVFLHSMAYGTAGGSRLFIFSFLLYLRVHHLEEEYSTGTDSLVGYDNARRDMPPHQQETVRSFGRFRTLVFVVVLVISDTTLIQENYCYHLTLTLSLQHVIRLLSLDACSPTPPSGPLFVPAMRLKQ